MDYLERKIASILQSACALSFSILIFSCSQDKDSILPYYNTPDFDPLFIYNQEEVEAKVPHTLDDFSFTDQENQTITQKDIEGKIHVANFMFTTCGSICPKMTNHMKLVSDAFINDNDVRILSFSVTPWIDDVERLHSYAELNEINSKNWHLLTGSKPKIYELARKSYFAEENMGYTKDSTEFLHTEHFLLVDKTKRIRGIYNGTLQLEMEQLIKDIEELKKETL
jgi:protein SCO1